MVKLDCYVGNVDTTVTTELMWSIFSEAGHVIDIRMKNEPSRAMGFCFVEYAEPDHVR
jgi:RNA recognition motif-containing protein